LGYDLSFYNLSKAIDKLINLHTVFIDEIQNFTLCMLFPFLSGRFHFHFAGDSNQSALDPRSNLERIRQTLLKNAVVFKEHLFKRSYRISREIAEVLEGLLRMCDTYCPRLGNDKTATHKTEIGLNFKKGAAYYYDLSDKAQIKYYQDLCKQNPRYVVVVQDETQLETAKREFGPHVLTLEAIAGGEYSHVILLDPFKTLGIALARHPEKEINPDTILNRQKDKQDTTGEELVTMFKKAYVALSRPRKSLIVFYNTTDKKQCYIVEHLKNHVQKSPAQTKIESNVETKQISDLSPTHLRQPSNTSLAKEKDTKVKKEKNRLGWIYECNKYLKRAFGTHKPLEKESFLKSAKQIFNEHKLKAKDLTLPKNCDLPDEYACFLPKKSIVESQTLVNQLQSGKSIDLKHDVSLQNTNAVKTQLPDSMRKIRYIKILLDTFSEASCKPFLNKSYEEINEFLFYTVLENNLNLWDTIFHSKDKTIIFLNILENSPLNTHIIIIMACQFYANEKINSTHHEMLIQLDITIQKYKITESLFAISNFNNGCPNEITKPYGHYMGACGLLGGAYLEGTTVLSQDITLGIKFLKEACLLGHNPSQYYLSQFYSKGGYGIPPDPNESALLLRQAADGGDVSAQIKLGDFSLGENNFTEGVRFYHLAHEQGNPLATIKLARLYQKGIGVPIDIAHANRLINNLNITDNLPAQCELGLHYLLDSEDKTNRESGFSMLLSTAKKGIFRAQRIVAQCYLKGTGVNASPEEHSKWTALLENENAYLDADVFLNNFNESTITTFLNQDLKTIYKYLFDEIALNGKNLWDNIIDSKTNTLLFLQMADSTDSAVLLPMIMAEYYLKTKKEMLVYRMIASLYDDLKSHDIAVNLLSIANLEWGQTPHNGSYASVMGTLGYFYIRGFDPAHNQEDGLALCVQAAECGDTRSHYNLGMLFIDGMYGFKMNLKKGLQHMRLACNEQHESALRFLGNAYLEGTYLKKNMHEGQRLLSLIKPSVPHLRSSPPPAINYQFSASSENKNSYTKELEAFDPKKATTKVS
jgi:TPR repeat protein